jgi:hypothetical protein
MVGAFIRALDREPWQSPRRVEPPPPEAGEAATKDHDDPTMPIEVVSGP